MWISTITSKACHWPPLFKTFNQMHDTFSPFTLSRAPDWNTYLVTFWPWFHVRNLLSSYTSRQKASFPPTMNVDILLVIASGDTLEVEWGCVFTTVPSWRRAYMHIECDTSYAVHYQPIESSTHSTCTCTSGGGINNQQKTMRVLIPVLTEFVPSPWAAAEFPPSVHQMTSRDHPSSLL